MGLLDAKQVGDDAGIRALLQKIAELEASARENVAALGGVAGLIEAQQGVADQLDFLANQVSYAVTDATLYGYYVAAPKSSYAVPYDAARSATLTVTTSGTGRLAVEAQCGWSIFPAANVRIGADVTMFVEVLNGATTVMTSSTGAPQASVVRNIPANSSYAVSTADGLTAIAVIQLDPNTTYTLRTRLLVNTLLTGNDLSVSPMSLKVTKLGM